MYFGKKIEINLIESEQAFDSYHVIVDPYGGNYPETNFENYPVYTKY
jgi:hypothetical protein